MTTALFSAIMNAGFDETLLKLKKSLSRECFEIISESEVFGSARGDSFKKYVRVLCRCNSKISNELLKNEEVAYVPAINFLVLESGQNISEVTTVDPLLTMTPDQAERMERVASKLREMVKNVIRNL